METNTKKAVIYCRVSTKEQVVEGNSLASQEKICQEYALRKGYEVAKTFLEKGESAKTDDRTELIHLITFCKQKSNHVQVVIFYKIDRWARYLLDYGNLKLTLKKENIIIQSATENLEDTPSGRFMENVLASQAQFDNELRAERCAGGMKDAMREGRYVWSAPFGYSNVRINSRATIAPNEKASILQRVFQEVAKNQYPTEEIRRRVSKEGLVNAKGKPYCRSQFYRLLCNEVYTGWIIKFGERHMGLFEPLVSDELFEQVQRVLKRRSHKSLVYLHEHPDFPLRRFIYHPSGKKITGHWSMGRTKKYPYYRFLGINRSQIRKEALEEAYRAFIGQYTLDDTHLAYFKKALKNEFGSATDQEEKETKRLKAYIDELKGKQAALIDKNLEGVISNSLLQQQLDLTEERLLIANRQLLALPDKKANLEELFKFADTYLQNPAEVWSKSSFRKKLKLQWCEFPQGIVFDGKKFRTTQIASIFKSKSDILPALSHEVDFMHKSSNHSKIPNSEILSKALIELKNLAEILAEPDL